MFHEFAFHSLKSSDRSAELGPCPRDSRLEGLTWRTSRPYWLSEYTNVCTDLIAIRNIPLVKTLNDGWSESAKLLLRDTELRALF